MNQLIFIFLVLFAACAQAGGLDRDIYNNIQGSKLISLKSSPDLYVNPSVSDVVTDYESPKNYSRDFGVHIRGYITIPETGAYEFYLASDDQGEFYLSTDTNPLTKQLLASVPKYTGYRQFDKYESQKSVVVNLVAGQKLYTESYFKEGGGGDHLTVAWSINSGPIEVITNQHLGPYFDGSQSFVDGLTNSIADAQSIYDQSSTNIGVNPGQYSEALRFNLAVAITKAQSVLDNPESSSRSIDQARIDLEKVTSISAGGNKPVVLNGQIFGAEPVAHLQRGPAAAFDKNESTYYQYFAPDEGYVGIDLGAGNETSLTSVRYRPQINKLNRLKKNKFQGSNDGINYVDIYTIPDEGIDDWNSVEFTDAEAYRYYRYYDVSGSADWGIIAEVEFLGYMNQDLHLQKHEIVKLVANQANQVISAENLTAAQGGLLPEYLTFKIIELPANGTLFLDGVALNVDSTFTQVDLNNGLLSLSTDDSRQADSFKVEVTSAIGGLLPEVIVDIIIDSDGDGLTDLEEIALGTNYDLADTDGDGVSDLWESENGLDALSNETTELVSQINGENGLVASYNYGSYRSTSDFATASPAKVAKVSAINFPAYYWNEFSNSGVKDYVGARFTGYLYVPVEGNYRFFLTSDDGSKLYINNNLVIDNDGLHGAVRLENTINLTAGFHRIRCEYFESRGSQVCVLQWQGPNRPLETIPAAYYFLSIDEYEAAIDSIDQDQDGLVDTLEAQEGTDPLNPDSDGDRLLDGEEYHAMFDYKTNPLSVDTDGDTVSDYDEIFVFFSNPLVPDFDGSVVDIINIVPSETSSRLGEWQEDGDEIFIKNLRGYVEYKVLVPIPGLYRFDIEAAQDFANSPKPEFDLHLYVDGEFVGRQKQEILFGEPKTYSFLSTNLRAGEHTFRIFWENVYRSTKLRIKSLTLSKPGGPDEDNNGNPDWVDSYVNSTYSLDSYQSSSKVSPAQIEGKGRYLTKILKSFGEPVQRGTFNRWFADINLTKEEPKTFTIEFEHGLKPVTGQISWEETNILDEGSMSVRQGASMLLNAVIDGDLESSSTITITDEEGNLTSYEAAPDSPLEYKFEAPGVYTINADYSGSEITSKTMTVKVIGAPQVDEPFIWRTKPRFWNWDGLTSEVKLEAEGMELSEVDGGYTLKRDESLESINIVARLGDNGPIIKSLETHSFWIRDVVESVVAVVEELEDGTKITNDTVFAWGLTDEMEVKVNTISGVTFPDGSRLFTLTKDHFDELNQWTLELIKSSDRSGANCHWFKMWQNGTFVGEKNK